MALVKKPVKKAPTPTKTIAADDFDNNPATILRNGGKVKSKKKGLPKKTMGGKMKKGC